MNVAEDRRLKGVGLALLTGAALELSAVADAIAAGGLPTDGEGFAKLVLGVLVGVNLTATGLLTMMAGFGVVRPRSDHRWWRIVGLRIGLANILVPTVLLTMLIESPKAEAAMSDSLWAVPAILGGYVFALLAWRLWRRTQRMEAPDAAEAMAADQRPPILYLRSFADDGAVALEEGKDWFSRAKIAALVQPTTPEQELAAILSTVGPLIAIGRPGESWPELGAARLYVPDDQWQARVLALMDQAGLVVLRLGNSLGLRWEVEQALDRLPRQRLVLVFGADAVVPEVAQRLQPVLGDALAATKAVPRPTGWVTLLWRDPRRHLGGLVYFDAAGHSNAVPLKAWPISWRDWPMLMSYRPSAPALRSAWRSVFAGLGLDDPARGRPRSRATAVALAMMVGWAGAHWFYLGHARRGWLYLALFPLFAASVFAAWADALRFILMDQASFYARVAVPPSR